MFGFDAEFGAPLPHLGRYGVTGYLGLYHYQVDAAQQIWGPRVRFEAQITNSTRVELAFSDDNTFGTSVVLAAV